MTKQLKGTKRPMNTGWYLKRVCLALVVLLVASAVMVGAGSAEDPTGKLNAVYTSNKAGVVTIWGDLTADPANELYIDVLASDGAVMGSVKLNDVDNIYAATTTDLTWHMMVLGEEYDSYWSTTWNEGYPVADKQPTTAKLYVDDTMVDESAVLMTSPDDLVPVTWTGLFVAELNGKVYGSLQAAIDAAADSGNTVTLLTDTTETGIKVAAADNLIIDLNGKILTGDILSYGILTVKNGTITNTAVLSGIESNGASANLTVQDLTITTNRHALRIDGGKATIISGTYTTTAGDSVSGYAASIGSDDLTTEVTIKGGEFKTNPNSNVAGHCSVTIKDTRCTVTITGGIFNTGETNSVENGGDLTINGGTFNGKLVDNGEASIFGGTFNYNVNDQTDKEHVAIETSEGKWEVVPGYEITFDGNTGTGDMPKQYVRAGIATALPENKFTKDTFDFAAWNTQANGKGATYANKAETTVSADTKLYAQWKAASYDITSVVAPEGKGTVDVPATAQHSSDVTVSVEPSTGYEPDDITVSLPTGVEGTAPTVTKNGNAGTFTMPTSDVTVTVTFKAKEYAVSIGEISNDVTVTTSATNGKAAYESEVSVTAAANPVAGFDAGVITVKEVISGKEITVTDGKFKMPAADVIVTATFEPKTFTVTPGSADVNGTISVPSSPVAYNSTVNIGLSPKDNTYKLEAITLTKTEGGSTVEIPISINDNTASFTMPAYGVTVTATFKQGIFAISTSVSPAEGGTISANPISVENGGSTTVTAAAAEGYEFTKFTVDGTDAGTANTYTISNIDKDTQVIAYFTAKTFSVTQGTITGDGRLDDLPLENVAYGTDVTIDATAETGYTFESLTISYGTTTYTTTKTTFKMPAASVTVSATFAPEEHTLEIVKSNDETVTISPEKPKTGETVTVTVTPKAGYEFVNFTVTGVAGDVTTNPGTFTMPAEDATITINTTAIEYDVKKATDTVNGDFTVSTEKAIVNEVITVIPEEDEGYVLDKITVVSDEGEDITVAADNTFPMPADHVTVFVTFKLTSSDSSGSDDNAGTTTGGSTGNSGSSGSSTWLPSTPGENQPPITGTTTVTIQNGGTATISGSAINSATFPAGFSGTVTITPASNVAGPAGKETYAKVDISLSSPLPAGQTATISFSVPLADLQARGLTAADACLYHGGANGWTPLLTTYSISGNVVNYNADASEFSPFAVVFEKGGATPADGQPTQTETPSTPGFGVLAVLAGLGAVVALRRQ